VSLSASGSSSNVALGWVGVATTPPAPPVAWVCNTAASVTAYVAFGGSGVTATTSNFPVNGGECVALAINGATYLAGITSSSTAALQITSGSGHP